MADFNPYQAPSAHVDDLDNDGELTLAGRGERLGAAILDTVILLALVLPVMFALGWMEKEPNPLFALLVGQVVFLLLNGYLLYSKGQTIGKKLLGIRITRPNGDQPNFSRIYGLRYLLGAAISAPSPIGGAIFGIVDALFIFRDSRRCIHDLIADTVVIKA